MQLLAAAMFWGLRWFVQRFKKLSSGRMFWLPYVFYVLAILSLLFWPLPIWGESIVSAAAWLFSWVCEGLAWVIGNGATGGIIASLALCGVLFGTVADLCDKKPDRWAKYATFTAAPLAVIASAEFAPVILGGIQTVGGVGPQVLSALA